VQGDLQRLCQAFGNLFGNAIKFTPDGGAIVISGRTLDDTSDGHPQRFVEVLFADTGIGIDLADQGLIFEKFYRVGAVSCIRLALPSSKARGRAWDCRLPRRDSATAERSGWKARV